MTIRDRKGQVLLAGDKVRVTPPGQRQFDALVKGPVRLAGNVIEQRIVAARIGQLGYKVSEIVELQNGSWMPLKFVERIGTTFEAAEMSFPKLLESLRM